MKEYFKKSIFFIFVIITAAFIIRIALPKTINVRIIGNISTITDVMGSVDAHVSGAVDTETKVRF